MDLVKDIINEILLECEKFYIVDKQFVFNNNIGYEEDEKFAKTAENPENSYEQFLDKLSSRCVTGSGGVADLSLMKHWYKLTGGRAGLRVLLPFSTTSSGDRRSQPWPG